VALLDKMKEQAAQAAQKAQEAAQRGQAKIDEVQAKRHEDALLRDLGAAVYAERTGTAGSGNAGEIDRLIADITAGRTEEAAAAASGGSATETGTPQGDFTLD
jgi:hypothetical protein